MNHLKYFCFIVIILALFSCEKTSKTTIVQGCVSDSYTNEPVTGITLCIAYADPKSSDFLPLLYSQGSRIAEVAVNSQGCFDFLTNDLEDKNYWLIFSNDSMVSSIEYQVLPYMENTYSIVVKKVKNYNLIIQNSGSVYNKAEFSINHGPYSKSFTLNGFATDTLLQEKMIPDRSWTITCTLTKPNLEDSTFTRSLFISNDSTIVSYTIQF